LLSGAATLAFASVIIFAPAKASASGSYLSVIDTGSSQSVCLDGLDSSPVGFASLNVYAQSSQSDIANQTNVQGLFGSVAYGGFNNNGGSMCITDANTVMVSSAGDGDFYLIKTHNGATGTVYAWGSFTVSGGVITAVNPPPPVSRFIEVAPPYGTTTPDLSFDVSGTYFYNPDDFDCPWWQLICSRPSFINVTVTNLEKGDRFAYQFPISEGENSFSTTTVFENAGFAEALFDFGGYPYGEFAFYNPQSLDYGLSTSTRFIVVSSVIPFSTFSSSGIVPGTVRFSTSTTPGGLVDECFAPTGTDRILCWMGDRIQDVLVYLFFPNASADASKWSEIFAPIANKPPFGYITSVSFIFDSATTTATSTLNLATSVSLLAPVIVIIDPLFASVFAIAFLFYVFKRFKHFEF